MVQFSPITEPAKYLSSQTLTVPQVTRLSKGLPTTVGVAFGEYPVSSKEIEATIRGADRFLKMAKEKFPERFPTTK